MQKHIAVIGAGPSGITAAKNLLDQGLQVTVFEAGGEVGGNWVFRDEPGHSSVFETTHIISSKPLSQYQDYPMPADYPDYPSHKQLADYFQGYARHFGLYVHIRFHTKVTSCEPMEGGRWQLTFETKDASAETLVFDGLVVCNGHHWLPRMPHYPGSFTGQFLHAHDVKRFGQFAGKRMLVIGGGNSACDVAVESSRVAERVDVSWRRGYWIVPKFMMGKPADVFSSRFSWLPRSFWQWSSALSLRIRNGRNSDYGLPEPEGPIGIHHPTVNEDFFYSIRHGKIKPRPDIERLEGNTVWFQDGRKEDYDVIVACTGYIISHPFFRNDLIDFSSGPVPLWLRMIPKDHANLYFIGLFQPLGCIWPGSELQSRIMANELAGHWKRPKDLDRRIRKELENPDYDQIDTPRHTITVNYHHFRKRLLKALREGLSFSASRQPATVEK